MVSSEVLKVAVAEPSMIIRSGLAVTLKRIPGFNIQPIEITDIESLNDTVRMYRPDVLIVNPIFLGYFNPQKFRAETGLARLKCVALVCSMMDQSLLKNYDETVTLCDGLGLLKDKFNKLLNTSGEDECGDQEVLSGREKEIVVCVVKGMANKKIADTLNLSTHTVNTHRRNIARKLQVHSPAGLTIYAIINKLVDLEDVK